MIAIGDLISLWVSRVECYTSYNQGRCLSIHWNMQSLVSYFDVWKLLNYPLTITCLQVVSNSGAVARKNWQRNQEPEALKRSWGREASTWIPANYCLKYKKKLEDAMARENYELPRAKFFVSFFFFPLKMKWVNVACMYLQLLNFQIYEI